MTFPKCYLSVTFFQGEEGDSGPQGDKGTTGDKVGNTKMAKLCSSILPITDYSVTGYLF